jgi:hypothetical protein
MEEGAGEKTGQMAVARPSSTGTTATAVPAPKTKAKGPSAPHPHPLLLILLLLVEVVARMDARKRTAQGEEAGCERPVHRRRRRPSIRVRR